MSQNIHFEIFKRQGAGGWFLIEVREKREDAMAYAQELVTAGATGVKVNKETFNDRTGDFLSLTIFEHGEVKTKAKSKQDAVSNAPCFRPDDFYSYHARKTIASLIPDFLAHNKVTVTELGHRADLLEKLEATGTLLQHAIQRVAVSQAASSDNELAKIIRALLALTAEVIHRVYRDAEKKRYVRCKPGEFRTLADKLMDSHDGRYLLDGTMALYLEDSKSWDDKVRMLMDLMPETEDGTTGAKLLLASIDDLISEVLGGSAGLRELIGAKSDHGAAVMSLVKLFLGREPDAVEGRDGLSALTEQFRADTLPHARVAVAHRLMSEIRSVKRLCPTSLEEEFRALRQIADLMVAGVGKYMSHEDLVQAFVLRSQRLITNESLAPYINGASPDVKLDRILFVEENIIGNENKRRLADFVTPIITSAQFEERFQLPSAPLVQRLQKLEAYRDRVVRSSFQESIKTEIADTLDKVAAAVESRGHLFESVDKRNASPTKKAFTLIKLITSKTLTAPRLTGKAREMVIQYADKPGFLTGYVAQSSQNGGAPDRDAMVADLMRLLEKAGIMPQTGLKNIAA